MSTESLRAAERRERALSVTPLGGFWAPHLWWLQPQAMYGKTIENVWNQLLCDKPEGRDYYDHVRLPQARRRFEDIEELIQRVFGDDMGTKELDLVVDDDEYPANPDWALVAEARRLVKQSPRTAHYRLIADLATALEDALNHVEELRSA